MTNTQVKSRGAEAGRAGTQALGLLATPVNALVLEALGRESTSLIDLRRVTGFPAQTTIRGYLRALDETGLVRRLRRDAFPGSLDYELTEAGGEMLIVLKVLRDWLAAAPDGPLRPGDPMAKNAVKALVEGWDTSIMRALAARPLSLTELDSLIANVSYPSLERRLSAMRLAGQVRKLTGRGGGTPYTVTPWLRLAVAPLAAAARWERQHLRHQAPPISPREVEAAFLLAVPLLRLSSDVSGACRLAVELRHSEGQTLAGAMVTVEKGEIAECTTRLVGQPDGWAGGRVNDWLATLIERDSNGLELGGDRRLATALIEGLNQAVFAAAISGE